MCASVAAIPCVIPLPVPDQNGRCRLRTLSPGPARRWGLPDQGCMCSGAAPPRQCRWEQAEAIKICEEGRHGAVGPKVASMEPLSLRVYHNRLCTRTTWHCGFVREEQRN